MEAKRRRGPCFVIGFAILTVFLLVFNIVGTDPNQTNFDKTIKSAYNLKSQIEYLFTGDAEVVETQPKDVRPKDTKWIVVTSINAPTQDVKRLAALPGWTVVVVADKKTPTDWSHEGVHFLSVEKQMTLGLMLPSLLPFATYTRKNVGYLYAMQNGAEWIYDTDDDNKPFGLGLEQFDYDLEVSGLRYRTLTANASVQERLFNPYRYFGRADMWPRGFPLEYLADHTNGEGRYLLCHEMKAAAVQQGLVFKDPDVDAIYRLLHADPKTGLKERFNHFAPAVVLERGTYAPWNSQNTLFHRRAFFTMFLPTTVEFRVTDIWRSYFAQKLLHLIGETVAFYPVNAIQIRNAHNYLADFEDEKAVYMKSGRIVEFLNEWRCSENTTQACVLELAGQFRSNDFFGEAEVPLIAAWLKDLEKIGYKFPELANATIIYQESPNNSKRGNCRRANINLNNDLSYDYNNPQLKRAEDKVRNFGELLEWCEESENSTHYDEHILSAARVAKKHSKMPALTQKMNSVLVMVNNYPWRQSIGTIQRMYEPYFAMIIFCGSWFPEQYNTSETAPPMRGNFNYVHLTTDEMWMGYFGYFCISKIKDLRLPNVKGYFFVADDAIFNIWQSVSMDSVVSPWGLDPNIAPVWWNWEHGLNGSKHVIELVEGQYKNDVKVQKVWAEFTDRLMRNGRNQTAKEHMLTFNGRTISDFYYLPETEMSFFGEMCELFIQGPFFLELALSKLQYAAKKLDSPKNWDYMWPAEERNAWAERYNNTLLMMHPVKFSKFSSNSTERNRFCTTIIGTFKKQLFD